MSGGCLVPWISLAKSADVASGTAPRQHSPQPHARHPGSQQTVTMALSMTANLRSVVLGQTQELRARPAASSAARCPVVVRAQQQEVTFAVPAAGSMTVPFGRAHELGDRSQLRVKVDTTACSTQELHDTAARRSQRDWLIWLVPHRSGQGGWMGHVHNFIPDLCWGCWCRRPAGARLWACWQPAPPW